MFMVIRRFVIAKQMVDEVKQAFLNRPLQVHTAPDFQCMEVVSRCGNPAETRLLTSWNDAGSICAWYHSHPDAGPHHGIPWGLTPAPKSSELRCFNIFAD